MTFPITVTVYSDSPSYPHNLQMERILQYTGSYRKNKDPLYLIVKNTFMKTLLRFWLILSEFHLIP